MEASVTPPCSSEGPVLYDNNHLNKINPHELRHTYRKNQAIVYLDPTEKPNLDMCEKIQAVKKTFCQKGVPYDEIKVRKCGSCDINIPLFLIEGPGVDTVVVSEGVPGGTSPQPKTVGESYSLNFLSQIKLPDWQPSDAHSHNATIGLKKEPKKETVTIAVLDTGLDTQKLVDPAYVCDDFTPKEYMPCFNSIKKGGWNFLNNSDDYQDDNSGRHGSLVSQYIINQFKGSAREVKIMPLKTHDENGGGDLFSIICAIHFAMAKGANIINASWGFYYYYDENFLKYFRNLIGNELQKKDILFVTAAGNRIPEEDELARRIYNSQNHRRLTDEELRDLGKHKFFPANLSHDRSNIITVTTTNVKTDKVSGQQNHSDIYVDLGIKADVDKNAKGDDDPSFEIPFKPGKDLVAGSSFATAIATGQIGANTAKSLPGLGLSKSSFITAAPVAVGRGLIKDDKCITNFVH